MIAPMGALAHRRPRARRAGLGLGAGVLVALALAAVAPAAGTPRPVAVKDARDAGAGAPDLTRVQLGMASDGRLRAALTLAADWVAHDLLDGNGPPGSLCLRLWTKTDPGAAPPDFLACITAADDETARGTVLQNRAGQPPLKVATAVVGRTSVRTATLRFSLSAIGAPSRIRFAAEATKPGCARVSCVDTAPDAPTTATLRLKGSAG
jgi:hypothetical protein